MKGLLGIKVGMTQVIEDDGTVTPVTVIQAGPCYVTQIKTDDVDGYSAVQVGFLETKEQRLSKGQKGHLGLVEQGKKAAVDLKPLRHLREYRMSDISEFEVGQALTVEQFEVGEKVDVTGKTKGKGFAGGVKRHGFGGGPKTHGQSDRWRAPGSIGATSGIARVFKGTRMAGHMGDKRHTVQNLEVMRVDPERNLIAIKGPVPGAKGGLVSIKSAVKASA